MPGQFRCPKCGFQLSKQTMSMTQGCIGTTQENRESDPCPNDGTMMLHVTYREQLEVYADRLKQELDRRDPRIKIICLCGSTRFIEQFAVKTWELELEGHIVLGCTLLPSWYCPVRDHFAEKLGVKKQRDEHHLRKIDLADEVLVLNIGGYIGESTKAEIAYASAHGKPVRYVEVVNG
jgi:hypothetical protein